MPLIMGLTLNCRGLTILLLLRRSLTTEETDDK